MNQFEEEVREVERGLVASILRRDSGALRRILADELTAITPLGELLGKSQMAGGVEDEDLVNESIETGEIAVRVYGETAVVTGRAQVKSRYKERDFTGAYRYTRVYARRPEGWLLVAYQATRIADE